MKLIVRTHIPIEQLFWNNVLVLFYYMLFELFSFINRYFELKIFGQCKAYSFICFKCGETIYKQYCIYIQPLKQEHITTSSCPVFVFVFVSPLESLFLKLWHSFHNKIVYFSNHLYFLFFLRWSAVSFLWNISIYLNSCTCPPSSHRL